MTTPEDPATAYHMPLRFNPITIWSTPAPGKMFEDYLASSEGFALWGDLASNSIDPREVEDSVNMGRVAVAAWPDEVPATQMFWLNDEKTNSKLSNLADVVVNICTGDDNAMVQGGDLSIIGAEFGSQQMALVGIIYAVRQGRLKAIPEFGRTGPLYVVKGSLSATMFDILLDKVDQEAPEA